jgi:hypothetical protein
MPSKASFVRSLPRSLTAKEVVKKAKAAGIKLSTAYVYVLRSKAGGGSKAKGRKPGRPKQGGIEQRFVDLALEVGIGRAAELLARVRSVAKA